MPFVHSVTSCGYMKLEGNICGQVFLHYNHIDGQFAEKNKFDGRPMLGLPKFNK